MKIVAATCSEQFSGPLDSGLPSGLLAFPALVRVIRGTAYIPVVNVGSVEVVLHPHIIVVGTLDTVCQCLKPSLRSH